MLLAFFYAFISMVCFGVANAIAKPVIEIIGPVRTSIFRSVVTIFVIGSLMIISEAPFVFDTRWILIGSLIAALSYGGFIAFMYSIGKGSVGVVVPVASFRIVIMALFGFVFLNEAVTSLSVFIVVVVTLGVMLSSFDLRAFKDSDVFSSKSGVPFALLSALVWGVTIPLFKLPSETLGSLWYTLIIEATIFLMALFHYRLQYKSFEELIPKTLTTATYFYILIVGVGTGFATFFLNQALITGYVSIASAVTGASAFISLIIGVILFGERLKARQYAGAFITTVGVLFPLVMLF